MPGKSSARLARASPTPAPSSSYDPPRMQGMTSTASNTLSTRYSASTTGTHEMLNLTMRSMTSRTEVLIVAVARLVLVPRPISRTDFLRSTVLCSLLTAMNLRMRYWVMTLTTESRRLSESLSARGMRRDRVSSIRRQASYSGRSGWTDMVSRGSTPMALSMSAAAQHQHALTGSRFGGEFVVRQTP